MFIVCLNSCLVRTMATKRGHQQPPRSDGLERIAPVVNSCSQNRAVRSLCRDTTSGTGDMITSFDTYTMDSCRPFLGCCCRYHVHASLPRCRPTLISLGDKMLIPMLRVGKPRQATILTPMLAPPSPTPSAKSSSGRDCYPSTTLRPALASASST